MTRHALLIAVASLLLSACGGSKLIVSGSPFPARPRAIATTSDAPEVAEALAAGMKGRGYSILGPAQTSALVQALTGTPLGRGQAQASQDPALLSQLKERKVDAVMAVNVRKTNPDYFGNQYVDIVALSLYGTSAPGVRETGLEWHNSWGGMPGSPADHMMRKTMDGIVAEVGAALASLLGPPGPAVSVDMSETEAAKRSRPQPEAAVASAAASSASVASQSTSPEPAAQAQPEAAPAAPKRTPVTAAEAAAELLP